MFLTFSWTTLYLRDRDIGYWLKVINPICLPYKDPEELIAIHSKELYVAGFGQIDGRIDTDILQVAKVELFGRNTRCQKYYNAANGNTINPHKPNFFQNNAICALGKHITI